MDVVALFALFERLAPHMQLSLLARITERVSLTSETWSAMATRALRVDDEALSAWRALLVAFRAWADDWLAHEPSFDKLRRYVALPESADAAAVHQLVVGAETVSALAQRAQKRALNELEQRSVAAFGGAQAAEVSPAVPALSVRQPDADDGGTVDGSAAGASAAASSLPSGPHGTPRVGRVLEREIVAAVADVMDGYLLALAAKLVELYAHELRADVDGYAHAVSELQRIAAHLIGTALPMFERACANRPEFIERNLLALSVRGLPRDGAGPLLAEIVLQAKALHHTAALSDVYLFPRALVCHEGGVRAIARSHLLPAICATAGGDCVARIYNVNNRQCLGELFGHRSVVTCVAFSHDDKLLLTGSADHTLRLWSATNATVVHTLTGHTDAVSGCAFVPRSALVCSCAFDRTVRLWHTGTGECVRVLTGHTHWVKTLRVTADGRFAVSGGLDAQVIVWSLAERDADEPVLHVLEHDDIVLDLDVASPNLLITVSRDRAVRLWEMATGTLLRLQSHFPFAWGAAVRFLGAGALYLIASHANVVVVCATRTGEQVRELRLHNEGVLCVAYSPGSLFVGTSSGRLQAIVL